MNKYKTLAANTLIFSIGSFGSKILLLFMMRIYTGQLSGADLSTKELLEITANFLVPIFSFSITEAIIRYGLDKQYDKRQVFSNACVIELFGALLLILLSPLLRLLPYTDGYTVLLFIYICTSCFRSLCSQFVRARGLVRLFTFDGILTTLMLCLYNILFLCKFHWGVRGFLLAVILSDLGSGLFLWFFAGLSRFFSLKAVDRNLTNKMVRFSLPLIPTAVLWIVTGFSDRLFLIYMDGPAGEVGQTAAGVYSASTKIPNLVSMASTIFYQAWNMSAIMENASADRNRFFERVFSAYQSLLCVASAFLIALVHPLSSLLLKTDVHPEYGGAYLYTPILVCASMLMCCDQFLSSIYTVTKRTRNSFYTCLAATVSNLVLNWLLIGRLGVYGAIIATYLSYLICYILRIIDARKLVPFPVRHILFLYNNVILLCMSVAVIFSPPLETFWLVLGTVLIVILNARAILDTIRKILKR